MSNTAKYLKYKNKYKILQKQIGESPRNIIFACTTLSKESTLNKNFDMINNTIKKIPCELNPCGEKNAHFVYKLPEYTIQEELFTNNYLEHQLIENNYTIQKDNDKYVFNLNLVMFINSVPNTKFNIIISAQCNDFVSIFTGDRSDTENKLLFHELVSNNLKKLYDCLSDDGVIINYYYDNDDNTSKCIPKDFYRSKSFVTYGYFDVHIILYKCICKIFTKIYFEDVNVEYIYKKKPGYTDHILSIYDAIKQSTDDEIKLIVHGKDINESINAISEKYFHGEKLNGIEIIAITRCLKQYL